MVVTVVSLFLRTSVDLLWLLVVVSSFSRSLDVNSKQHTPQQPTTVFLRGVSPFAFISHGSKITCCKCTPPTVKMGAHHWAMTLGGVRVTEPPPPTTATRCYTLRNEDASGTMQGCRRVCEIANGTPRSSGPPRRTSSQLPTPATTPVADISRENDWLQPQKEYDDRQTQINQKPQERFPNPSYPTLERRGYRFD